MALKKCSRCKTEKFLALFSRHKSHVDGRNNWCKECVKKYYSKPEIKKKQQEYARKHRSKPGMKEKRHKYYLENYQEQYKKQNQENKRVILKYYSNNRCECCRESRQEFLCLDHINGGGVQHRRKLNISSGAKFYKWIIKNNFPPGFRALCHNCNQALGFYGACPHEKEKFTACNKDAELQSEHSWICSPPSNDSENSWCGRVGFCYPVSSGGSINYHDAGRS